MVLFTCSSRRDLKPVIEKLHHFEGERLHVAPVGI